MSGMTSIVTNTMKNGSAKEKFARARSTCRFFSRYHALTLSISAEPAVHDATNTWRSRGGNEGVQMTSQKSVMTARAGADIIKEDQGLANQDAAPFRERVLLCAEAVARANAERAEDGDNTRALYLPNIGGHGDQVRDLAFYAKDAGADGILLIPGLFGFDAMNRLAQDPNFDLPIMAHPSHLGPYVLSPDHGYGHGMLFGEMMRLAGADISVFPNHGGRFGFSLEECAEIVTACRAEYGIGRPILPSPGGGMSIDRLPDMIKLYGHDCVYLLGGSLLRYGDRIGDALREMRAALGS